MRVSLSRVMLLGAVYNIEASKSPFLPNFEVIVDTSSSRNKKLLSNLRRYDSILSVNTESSEGSGKAAVERIRCEAVHIAGKILDEARVVVENVQAERKGVMKNIRHCSKLDICLYVAFAYVLTTTVKTMIFDRSAIKIVDIAKIIYILNSPVTTASFSPVTKLDRRHLKLYVSPTIVSTDDKTYPRTVRRITTKAPKRTPPPPPARPAQVVVDTVTTFYKQHDVHPASHNAVIEMMSPEMRRRLRTRRMRGGAMSSGLLHTLKVWVLVTFLLLILSRLWNIFPVLLFLAFTSRSG